MNYLISVLRQITKTELFTIFFALIYIVIIAMIGPESLDFGTSWVIISIPFVIAGIIGMAVNRYHRRTKIELMKVKRKEQQNQLNYVFDENILGKYWGKKRAQQDFEMIANLLDENSKISSIKRKNMIDKKVPKLIGEIGFTQEVLPIDREFFLHQFYERQKEFLQKKA